MASSDDDWSTRHSVLSNARRTAALVNALLADGATASEVADVLRAHGERGSLDLSVEDLDGMCAVARRLREVFAAPDTDTTAQLLNKLFALNSRTLRLSSHGGSTPWHPHLDSSDDAPWDEWFLASSALALMVLVWDTQRPVGGVCAATGCDRVFLAQGSGLARRYCSRRCATRERVAAHRRAQAAACPGALVR
ncbi:CGNR zinc finger domain-containing protein [Streptomyces sp. NA04227]|uniref:CGNR zinc finger domain-containing protein n=1 Tax=Streptomyces sp. NA04227 TaxID=2742136 RepID=UPI0015900B57|nr:CGNR zinc finger domain-containing protein [Streptomyces sp. NA04227]QKW05584.1 CGNR zinc finger domain-containing protein [Streptomyces sp. NA04227]